MKVGWLGKSSFLGLTYGEVYTVLSLEKGWLESLTVLVKIISILHITMQGLIGINEVLKYFDTF